MRETKFRGQIAGLPSHLKPRWAYGYLFGIGDHVFIVPDDAWLQEDEYKSEGLFGFIEVIPETVGEYIGREDKNGKEIYEGYIVLTNEFGWKAEVVFHNGMFMCENKGFSAGCEWDKFEIIGNKWDNPGLLEAGK